MNKFKVFNILSLMGKCEKCNLIFDDNFFYKGKFFCFRCTYILSGDLVAEFDKKRYEELLKKRAMCIHDFSYEGYEEASCDKCGQRINISQEDCDHNFIDDCIDNTPYQVSAPCQVCKICDAKKN